MTHMTKRDMFLAMLDERIRQAIPYESQRCKAIKVQFELLFPPYEIDVLPYDHTSSKYDKAVGYDYKEFETHPLMMKFNKDFYTLVSQAYKDKKPLPQLSIIMELLENLNIHPRLKMIAAYALQIAYSKFKRDFQERDMINEIKNFAGNDDPEALIKYLKDIKDKNQPDGK